MTLSTQAQPDHFLPPRFAELRAYAPLATAGSYVIVFDTVIKDLPAELMEGRPWSPERNAASAVSTFLGENPDFSADPEFDSKLLITVAPGGFLRRGRA